MKPDQRPLADRVQRIVDGDIPILHLEPEIPLAPWTVKIDGLVRHEREWELADIRDHETITRYIDLHCVWGWSRPDCMWEGVHFNALVHRVEPSPDARYIVVSARSAPDVPRPYASCLTLEEARDGIFAWRVGGRDLARDRGWPLRFVAPAHKWGYKSVKWVERITFTDQFTPGFWEERVGDPKGNVGWDVLERFSHQAEAWRRRKRR